MKLIIKFKKFIQQKQIEELEKLFDFKILKIVDGEYYINLPLQEYMGSADIEDLNECDEVEELYWSDHTVCHPRG